MAIFRRLWNALLRVASELRYLLDPYSDPEVQRLAKMVKPGLEAGYLKIRWVNTPRGRRPTVYFDVHSNAGKKELQRRVEKFNQEFKGRPPRSAR